MGRGRAGMARARRSTQRHGPRSRANTSHEPPPWIGSSVIGTGPPSRSFRYRSRARVPGDSGHRPTPDAGRSVTSARWCTTKSGRASPGPGPAPSSASQAVRMPTAEGPSTSWRRLSPTNSTSAGGTRLGQRDLVDAGIGLARTGPLELVAPSMTSSGRAGRSTAEPVRRRCSRRSARAPTPDADPPACREHLAGPRHARSSPGTGGRPPPGR